LRGCCFAQGRREEELLRHDTKGHFTIRSEDAFLPLPGSVVIRAPEQTWNVLTLAAPPSQHRKGSFLPSFPSFCQPAFLHRSVLHIFLTTCLSLTSWLLEYCPGRSTSRARQVLLTVIGKLFPPPRSSHSRPQHMAPPHHLITSSPELQRHPIRLNDLENTHFHVFTLPRPHLIWLLLSILCSPSSPHPSTLLRQCCLSLGPHR
jgi:hypothetical protein